MRRIWVVLALVCLAAVPMVAPATAAAITRQRANDAALRALDPPTSGRITVFGLPKPLSPGDVVGDAQAVALGPSGAMHSVKLKQRTWLFWEDMDVDAMFEHPSQLVLVDDVTGKVVLSRRMSWYPLVDGHLPPFLVSDSDYHGPKYQVYTTLGAAQSQRVTARPAPIPHDELPADAFKGDCILLVGLIPPGTLEPKEQDFQTKNSQKALAGWKALGNSLKIPTFYARSDGPSTSELPDTPADQVDSADLRDNVAKLVKDSKCKDILIYINGHGAKDDGAKISVAPRKTITSNDLKELVKDYSEPGDGHVDFKLVLETCYAAKFVNPLAGLDNLVIAAFSSGISEPSRFSLNDSPPKDKDGNEIKDDVANPGMPEFTHGLLEGIKKTLKDAAEVAKLRKAGGSLLARLIDDGFAKEKDNDRAAKAGLTNPPKPLNHLPPVNECADKRPVHAPGPAGVLQDCFTFLAPIVLPSGSEPDEIIAGTSVPGPGRRAPESNAVFFTESGSAKLGRLDTAGHLKEYPLRAGSTPEGLVQAPDGSVWVGELKGNAIARIAVDGTITEFPVPAGSQPEGFAIGPDGNVWFTEFTGDVIGRITSQGTMTTFNLPGGTYPAGMVLGPDGNFWFAEFGTGAIGRITPTGTVTNFPLPTPNARPAEVALGPDDNIWFGEIGGNKIGRITTRGVITEFPIPTGSSAPLGIAAGPDGAVWFSESGVDKLGRIVPTTGAVQEFPVPYGSRPAGIVEGPDGNMWFTLLNSDKIGKVVTTPLPIDRVLEAPFVSPA